MSFFTFFPCLILSVLSIIWVIWENQFFILLIFSIYDSILLNFCLYAYFLQFLEVYSVVLLLTFIICISHKIFFSLSFRILTFKVINCIPHILKFSVSIIVQFLIFSIFHDSFLLITSYLKVHFSISNIRVFFSYFFNYCVLCVINF